MIFQILIPLAILGGMGLIFGAGLAFASKKLAIEGDPRIEQARDCLPGANCGACGYAGCDAYAAAVVAGEASSNLCSVGGTDVANQLAAIMGEEPHDDVVRMVATVLCRGDNDHCMLKYDYQGLNDCQAAFLASGGEKACKYACLGLGSCAAVCDFGAITVGNGLVHIDSDKCVGCKRCIEVCPKNVIRLEEVDRQSVLRCRAAESGKDVRGVCSAGCIGCGQCEQFCKFGAIEMVNNLPKVDMEKCVGCLECVRVCPTRAMDGDMSRRKIAQIDEDACIGCTLCKRQCNFGAIEGELKGKHQVIIENCVGCGLCAGKCPKKCISMVLPVQEKRWKPFS